MNNTKLITKSFYLSNKIKCKYWVNNKGWKHGKYVKYNTSVNPNNIINHYINNITNYINNKEYGLETYYNEKHQIVEVYYHL